MPTIDSVIKISKETQKKLDSLYEDATVKEMNVE